jgi:hypothetical protein
MNERYQYGRFHKILEKACTALGWKFEENLDVLNRFDLEDAFGFSIDNVEYFVGRVEGEFERDEFYVSTVIQHHATRDEDGSEDERQLNTMNMGTPGLLLGTILNSHFRVRLDWVMQDLLEEEMSAELPEQEN